MSSVAIITARGGSKRIPAKNIKIFRGKPIIAYSIETALSSGLFDYVMVSTDDVMIAEVAKKFGAEVPFMRSKKNANDYSSTADVLEEVLVDLNKLGKSFEFFCCIYPTAPFITENTLRESFDLMVNKKFDSVFPVCKFSFPIQRALQIKDSKTSLVWPENLNRRSQDLEPRYHDAGQFYWMRSDVFMNEKKVFTTNSGSVILDELQVQDIDNESDWKIAELKHALVFPANV